MKGKDELNCKAFERHCKGSSLQSELQGAMGGLKCHHRKGSVFDSFINDSTEDALWAENLAGQDWNRIGGKFFGPEIRGHGYVYEETHPRDILVFRFHWSWLPIRWKMSQ